MFMNKFDWFFMLIDIDFAKQVAQYLLHTATGFATLRKVEDCSTFSELATLRLQLGREMLHAQFCQQLATQLHCIASC